MGFADSYLGRLRAAMGSAALLSIGVRVLVEDDRGRFLILKRSDGAGWGLPGGGMEPGESLLDTAHRESFEEANVRLGCLTPFALSSDPARERYTYPNGDEVQFVSLMVHGTFAGGSLASNDGEALAFRFMAEDEIDMTTLVAPERPVFGLWRRYRETGAFQVV